MNKNLAYILIIILLLLVLSLVSVMGVAIKNGGFSFGNSTYNDLIKEESYSLNEIEKISLDLKLCDVEFFESETDELKVVQYGNNDSKEFNENINSKSITISDSHSNFMFFNFGRDSRYEVYLPSNYSGNLLVETVSGEITLDSFTLNLEKVEFKSVSGDIRLDSKFISNEASIKTVSGEININQISAEEVTLKTTSGDIEVNSIVSNDLNISTVSGEIVLDYISNMAMISTTSGDITIDDLIITEDSKISTVSGEIEININEESNCIIKTDSVSGNIDIRNNNFKDAEYELNIKTTSGDIEIN